MSAPDLFSLAGTAALVTGGANGIGLSTARQLARAGARVMILDLPGAEPVAVAARASESGADISGYAADAADPSAIRDAIAHTVQLFGRLDAVVASAGISLEDDPSQVGGDVALHRMLALHVFGVHALAEASHQHLAVRGGSFVVISSIAGLRGNRVIGSYGITKAASAQLARNLAVQWGADGIRVNAIAPGAIDTDFAAPITRDPERARQRLARTPMGRFGTADEVAGTVAWLVSPAGGFVTGQTIVVDGGTLVSD